MVPQAYRVTRVVRFAVFEADLQARELRKHGLRIKLQNQPFEVLAALLERPGEVVPREELYQRLWPDQTFVDFEHNLNAIVKKLRRALADTAGTPRFVETVARRGYRFVAPVVIEPGPEPRDLRPKMQVLEFPIEPRPSDGRRSHRFWTLALAGCLAAILAAVALYGTIFRPSAPELVAFATGPGKKLDPAFSPDGRSVAYAWDTANHDRWNIFIQEIGSTTPRRVTNYAGDDCSPVFSPDGRYIAFTREHRDLMIVPAVGGPERRIAGVENGTPMGLDFTPDGKSIATVDRIPGSEQFAIFTVSTATGEKQQLTFPPPGNSDDTFRFSPDGRSLAFARGPSLDKLDIYFMPSGGGAARRLTSDESAGGGVGWAADGREIVYPAQRSGPGRIWGVPVSGGAPRPLTDIVEGVEGITVSRDGHRLAYAVDMQDVNIWRVGLTQPGNRPGPRTRLIASARLNHDPDFSPDGKQIAFSSDRSGSREIWISNSEGSGQKPVVSMNGAGNPRWSPDGKRLVFDVLEGSRGIDIYLVELAERRPRPVSRSSGFWPGWSRDGQWIYFASDRTGATQIWKMRPDGSGERQLTRSGGGRPKDSFDGQTIYYEKPGDLETEIWKISQAGGKESPAMTLRNGEPVKVMSSYWSPAPDGVYFLKRIKQTPMPQVNVTGNYQIQFYRFDTATAEPVVDIGEYAPHPGGLVLSPDRRSIIYGQIDRAETDIMLVNNFR